MAQEDALLVDTLAKQLECPICLDTILGEVEFPHNSDAQGFASFHVLFLGPESKRTGFKALSQFR
eukprot:COSAG02_NODE_19857_length_861_cov_1.269029_1_plen_65_part_00